jgi:hypothetical protein
VGSDGTEFVENEDGRTCDVPRMTSTSSLMIDMSPY